MQLSGLQMMYLPCLSMLILRSQHFDSVASVKVWGNVVKIKIKNDFIQVDFKSPI